MQQKSIVLLTCFIIFNRFNLPLLTLNSSEFARRERYSFLKIITICRFQFFYVKFRKHAECTRNKQRGTGKEERGMGNGEWGMGNL